MLNIKFKLIPIKIGFLQIFKAAKKSDQSLCTIVLAKFCQKWLGETSAFL